MKHRILAHSIVLAMLGLAPVGCASTDPAVIPPAVPAPAASMVATAQDPGRGSIAGPRGESPFEASLASSTALTAGLSETSPPKPRPEESAPLPPPDPLTVDSWHTMWTSRR
jgi:hypothetical protein